VTSQKIRVLIVDDFADTRDSITKLLYFERDIEVVGSAGDAQQGIRMAKDQRPDVILMDINMPGMDGIAATEAIYASNPECEVIMMSVQGEPDFLRRAMLAGAREYLVKPFTGDELAGSIRQVYELGADKRARLAAMQQPVAPAAIAPSPLPTGRMISVFSPKGGVGRTTVATNVAVAIRAATGKRIALVDCSLLFGDIAIMLNLPTSKTISDLIGNIQALDQDLLEGVMVDHTSGVRVLLAPSRPEMAELIGAEHVRKILSLLKSLYDYVVVDTHASFDDTMLGALDLSDRILVLTTLEMPAIKNLKLFLEVADALHYTHDKLMLVLNRADSTGGIEVKDIEESIRFKISANIVSAGQLMTAAVNQGVPVVMSQRESPVAKNIIDLATSLLTEADAAEAQQKALASAAASKEGKSGVAFGKLRLPSFAARRGSA
jgi:pilus assembly protein CpaE